MVLSKIYKFLSHIYTDCLLIDIIRLSFSAAYIICKVLKPNYLEET